jgi:hypothetical protein
MFSYWLITRVVAFPADTASGRAKPPGVYSSNRQHLLHELHCLSNTPPLVDVFMNLPETLEEDSLGGHL